MYGISRNYNLECGSRFTELLQFHYVDADIVGFVVNVLRGDEIVRSIIWFSASKIRVEYIDVSF